VKPIKNLISSTAERREPEEEFFMLTILALKMQYAEVQADEFIHKLDASLLYEQVK
jgi:hypothetical protein